MDRLDHIDFGDDACDRCGCDCGGCDCYMETAEPHMPDCPKFTDGGVDAGTCLVVAVALVAFAVVLAASVFAPR